MLLLFIALSGKISDRAMLPKNSGDCVNYSLLFVLFGAMELNNNPLITNTSLLFLPYNGSLKEQNLRALCQIALCQNLKLLSQGCALLKMEAKAVVSLA